MPGFHWTARPAALSAALPAPVARIAPVRSASAAAVPADFGGSIQGIDYGPFRDGQDPNLGLLPSQQQMLDDMPLLAGIGNTVRTYSVDNGLDVTIRQAASFGMKAIPSAFPYGDPTADAAEIGALVSLLQTMDTANVPFAVVESEAILRGDISQAGVISLISAVRAQIPNVPLAAAETWDVYAGNPALAAAVDVIAVNIHPYTDGVAVQDAAQHVIYLYQALRAANPGKPVVISETGWPTAGVTQGGAVPGLANAQTFWTDFLPLAAAAKVDFLGFEAFDEAWKNEEYPAGPDSPGPHWGLYTSDRVAKGGVTSLITPCFAAGSRIATARGPVPVERLHVGECVVTADGRRVPIVWLGHRRTPCRGHPTPHDVQPIAILPGAIAPGQPGRRLVLSPDHALAIDGVLVPVRHLVNGATIRRLDVDEVEYWHVELSRHEVILAEGLPVESYLDTGNRGGFANGAGTPDCGAEYARAVWAARACARLLTSGAALARIRTRLLRRAEALGHRLAPGPLLALLTRDGTLRPTTTARNLARFRLDGRVRQVTIASLSGIPAETSPQASDTRRLGVMLTAVALRQGRRVRLLRPEDFGEEGFHGIESDGTRSWRWTDGAALLSLPRLDDAAHVTLDLHLAAAQPGWLASRVLGGALGLLPPPT